MAFLLWRRKRDLNPRAGYPTYSLSRGAPSPLGYFCKCWLFCCCQRYIITALPIGSVGGEDGIRTHVRLLSNGFQDRLVMTASIPLHRFAAYNMISHLFPSCQVPNSVSPLSYKKLQKNCFRPVDTRNFFVYNSLYDRRLDPRFCYQHFKQRQSEFILLQRRLPR